MKSALAHAVLLGVALILALQAWLGGRGRSSSPSAVGDVVVWGDITPNAIRAVRYENERGLLLVEHREENGTESLWGSWTRVSPAADSSSGSATADVELFPVGDSGEQLLGFLAPLRALRDLGVLDDSGKAEYELMDQARTLTVTGFDDAREMVIGRIVFGSTHRYALDPTTGRGYVLASGLVGLLEGGRNRLLDRSLHEFREDNVDRVTVRTLAEERTMVRSGSIGRATWASPDRPAEPDQTFANFMTRIDQFSIMTYDRDLRLDSLERVLRIDYSGRGGAALGYLELYRTRASGQTDSEYYIETETTRAPAQLIRSVGERIDQDLAEIL